MVNKQSERALGNKPTRVYKAYATRLVFRVILFAFLIYVFATHPERLQFTEFFGPAHGFNTVDFVFIAIVVENCIRVLPTARVAMASKKQFREFHVPTMPMFEGGRDGMVKFAKDAFAQGRMSIESLSGEVRTMALESLRDNADGAIRILRSIDILRLLPFSDEQLSSTEQVRLSIMRRRNGEILPVIVFWITFNWAVGVTMAYIGVLNEGTILLWVQFYAVWDMFCVVLWCPLQQVFMKNRCCTTCQIFNWGAIMIATPLVIVPCAFSIILLLLSLFVLIRWEVSVARHPERFDERTNLSLQCANCVDKLCYIRTPLTVQLPRDAKIEPASMDAHHHHDADAQDR